MLKINRKKFAAYLPSLYIKTDVLIIEICIKFTFCYWQWMQGIQSIRFTSEIPDGKVNALFRTQNRKTSAVSCFCIGSRLLLLESSCSPCDLNLNSCRSNKTSFCRQKETVDLIHVLRVGGDKCTFSFGGNDSVLLRFGKTHRKSLYLVSFESKDKTWFFDVRNKTLWQKMCLCVSSN